MHTIELSSEPQMQNLLHHLEFLYEQLCAFMFVFPLYEQFKAFPFLYCLKFTFKTPTTSFPFTVTPT